eukprot:642725-Rhodomonas_salina.4
MLTEAMLTRKSGVGGRRQTGIELEGVPTETLRPGHAWALARASEREAAQSNDRAPEPEEALEFVVLLSMDGATWAERSSGGAGTAQAEAWMGQELAGVLGVEGAALSVDESMVHAAEQSVEVLAKIMSEPGQVSRFHCAIKAHVSTFFGNRGLACDSGSVVRVGSDMGVSGYQPLASRLQSLASNPSSDLWAIPGLQSLTIAGDTYEKAKDMGSPPRSVNYAPQYYRASYDSANRALKVF